MYISNTFITEVLKRNQQREIKKLWKIASKLKGLAYSLLWSSVGSYMKVVEKEFIKRNKKEAKRIRRKQRPNPIYEIDSIKFGPLMYKIDRKLFEVHWKIVGGRVKKILPKVKFYWMEYLKVCSKIRDIDPNAKQKSILRAGLKNIQSEIGRKTKVLSLGDRDIISTIIAEGYFKGDRRWVEKAIDISDSLDNLKIIVWGRKK